jgi:hypothetical protein
LVNERLILIGYCCVTSHFRWLCEHLISDYVSCT